MNSANLIEQNEITNLVQIYVPLAKTHELLQYESNEEAAGFLKCLYLIKRAMKKYTHINMHVFNQRILQENKALRLSNENQKVELKNYLIKNQKLSTANKKLREEIQVLRRGGTTYIR